MMAAKVGTVGSLNFFSLNFPLSPQKYLTECVVNDVSTDIKVSSVTVHVLVQCQPSAFFLRVYPQN